MYFLRGNRDYYWIFISKIKNPTQKTMKSTNKEKTEAACRYSLCADGFPRQHTVRVGGTTGMDPNAQWFENGEFIADNYKYTDSNDNNDEIETKLEQMHEELSPEALVAELHNDKAIATTEEITDTGKDSTKTIIETQSNVNEEAKEDRKVKYGRTKEEEDRKVSEWLNRYGRPYIAPIPKYLLLKCDGKRDFTKENVNKRTAWLGMALNVKDKDQVPPMSTIRIKKEQCISLKVNRPEIAKKLLEIKHLGPCKVIITKDPIRNSVHAVLRDPKGKFDNMTEEDITELLKDQGVIKTKIFQKNGKPIRTYKLTIDSLVCPTDITLGEYFFRLTEYVPPPLRCFKCQQYQHSKFVCHSKTSICQRCGEEGHEKEVYREGNLVKTCSKDATCFHCKGDHEAGHSECPVQIGYRRVNELIINQKISRVEAMQMVNPRRKGNTHAQVVHAGAQLEEYKEKEKKEKTAIEELNRKLDMVLNNENSLNALTNKVDKLLNDAKTTPTITANYTNADIQQMMENVVAPLKKQLEAVEKENEKTQNQLKQVVEEQKKTIVDLTMRNEKLENETKQLKAELKAAQQKLAGKEDNRSSNLSGPYKRKANSGSLESITESSKKSATGTHKPTINSNIRQNTDNKSIPSQPKKQQGQEKEKTLTNKQPNK